MDKYTAVYLQWNIIQHKEEKKLPLLEEILKYKKKVRRKRVHTV